MKSSSDRQHYSYSVYADPQVARTFDTRRFGGPIGEFLAEEQARVLLEFIGNAKDRSILDVGTGTGRAALLCASKGAQVTAVDASNEMLAVARQRALDAAVAVTFREGDVHSLDFPARSFDVVVCLRVLMHSPRWKASIAELCRVADAFVILDYPSRWSVASLQSMGRRLLQLVGVKTEAYRVFTDRQVRVALAEGGFRVRAVHRQFVLPIAFHKAIGSIGFTTAVEGMLRRLGLLSAFGSPVTLVAERCARS